MKKPCCLFVIDSSLIFERDEVKLAIGYFGDSKLWEGVKRRNKRKDDMKQLKYGEVN